MKAENETAETPMIRYTKTMAYCPNCQSSKLLEINAKLGLVGYTIDAPDLPTGEPDCCVFCRQCKESIYFFRALHAV